MARLKGVIAAAATPLNAAGRIDLEKLVAHCRRLLELGCDGINLLGTTGEATSFSVGQRVEAMERVARSGLDLGRFMVGSGGAALADAVHLTSAARDLGFAGALVLPPFYYKGIDVAGLATFFKTLIDAVGRRDLRIYLYHFPQNSGVPFVPEAVSRLLAENADVLVGLKDSSGDLAYATQIAGEHPGFDVFPSSESALSDATAKGYAGCISATLNVTVPLVAQSYRANGDRTAAMPAPLAQATAIRAALSRLPLVAAVKWALADLLDDPAWARVVPPLRAITPAEVPALREALESGGYPGLRRAFAT